MVYWSLIAIPIPVILNSYLIKMLLTYEQDNQYSSRLKVLGANCAITVVLNGKSVRLN